MASLELDQIKPVPCQPDLKHGKLNLNLKPAVSGPNFQGIKRRVSVFEVSTANEHKISLEIVASRSQTPEFDDASLELPCMS